MGPWSTRRRVQSNELLLTVAVKMFGVGSDNRTAVIVPARG